MTRKSEILIIIPTYNNFRTVADVIRGCKVHSYDILVVNDGSTDSTASILESIEGITLISFEKNRGKGAALVEGFRWAIREGYSHALTIDSDGQHITEDIPLLIEVTQKEPSTLWVGSRNLLADNMPGKNTFANRFSNFWFKIQTGIVMKDTQSGFRVYPLTPFKGMSFISGRYELELEFLVRFAWKGGEVKNYPVRVNYPPKAERVSHFRPFRDFLRISLLNTLFSLIAFLIYWPIRFCKWFTRKNLKDFFRENITHSKDSNVRIASAVGTGLFFGIVPIWGYQMGASLVVAHLLKLNKVLVLLFANISIPPFIPFILYGSFITGAYVLGLPVNIVPEQLTLSAIGESFTQYLIGAIVFAIVVGIVGFILAYVALLIIRRKRG